MLDVGPDVESLRVEREVTDYVTECVTGTKACVFMFVSAVCSFVEGISLNISLFTFRF